MKGISFQRRTILLGVKRIINLIADDPKRKYNSADRELFVRLVLIDIIRKKHRSCVDYLPCDLGDLSVVDQMAKERRLAFVNNWDYNRDMLFQQIEDLLKTHSLYESSVSWGTCPTSIPNGFWVGPINSAGFVSINWIVPKTDFSVASRDIIDLFDYLESTGTIADNWRERLLCWTMEEVFGNYRGKDQ